MAKGKQAHPLISLFDVSKTFSADPLDYKSLVLRNIYLDIYPGEFIIIFGPSGSGKSTLLYLMAGLEFATAGKITVRGRNLSHFSQRELARYHRLKMGLVFQTFNLIKSLRVWENVALPQAANGVRYKPRFRRARRLLKLFNIGELFDRHPNEISGGEQQRVAMARSLINNPFFLLVDEPTGNLDSKSAEEVMQIFHGLHRHGKHTLVLVTHNPNYLHYATRVLYLHDGRLVKEERLTSSHDHSRHSDVAEQQFRRLGEYKENLTPISPNQALPEEALTMVGESSPFSPAQKKLE